MKLGAIRTPENRLRHAVPIEAGKFSLAAPPLKVDRSNVDYTPKLYSNDILPNCTSVALANAAMAVAALDNTKLDISEQEVNTFFSRCVNCENTVTAIAATRGAVIMDVLERQVTEGFAIGDQTALVALHGVVSNTRAKLADIVNILGQVYLGVSMYDRDMQGYPVWDSVEDPGPYVGDHALILWDYRGLEDDSIVRLATWGTLQPVTWRWIEARLVEAHGLFWRQLSPARMSPEEADMLAMALMRAA